MSDLRDYFSLLRVISEVALFSIIGNCERRWKKLRLQKWISFVVNDVPCVMYVIGWRFCVINSLVQALYSDIDFNYEVKGVHMQSRPVWAVCSLADRFGTRFYVNIELVLSWLLCASLIVIFLKQLNVYPWNTHSL